MRQKVSFRLDDVQAFKSNLLAWSRQFHETVWLDSNAHGGQYHSFDAMLAVDALTVLETDAENGLKSLEEYQEGTNDWLFGYITYDVKNAIERLHSKNPDRLHFTELCFFQPKKIIRIRNTQVDFLYLNMIADEIQGDFECISKGAEPPEETYHPNSIRVRMGIFKDEYHKRVNELLSHIQRGDLYEANFCQEFYADNIEIDALHVFQKLNDISKAPFACFLKLGRRYLMCASPERYLKKIGEKMVSQPIKGTAKRSRDKETDLRLKTALSQDEKERAENIMIVDLVRNDLSKSAVKGSVTVEELCAVYSFEQVHQMISTVSARIPKEKSPVALIRESFPMGSMTGAPKVSAMKIIERLESFKRGLYSGSVGYFTPEGDFDFNVVIRSILYNEEEKYVSFSVGSAITAKALPEKEYEECLLKAKAMREVLEN